MKLFLGSCTSGLATVCLVLSFLISVPVLAQTPAGSAPALTEDQAHAIGVDAYLYFYPLVTNEVTRRYSTNVKPGMEVGKGPMNTFSSFPAFPTADNRLVARFNYDTLYSSAWIDLTREPVVFSVPDTQGRYYLCPVLDMWIDVFASLGWRTTGTQAGNFLVTPSGWSGEVPSGMTRISAPTPYVWILCRTKTDGPADYDAVHKIQAGYKVTPLSQWGKPSVPPTVTIDPSVDMKTPPKVQVDTMSAGKFFAYAAEVLKVVPPHITDQPIIAQLKKIGFEVGKSFDLDKADPVIQRALASAPGEAHQLMTWEIPKLAPVVNFWSMNTNTMGVYGNWYLKRAIVSNLAQSANVPEDTIYPLNLGDEDGKPLNGANKYTLHFDKGETPPVESFWSVTLYDADGFVVPNPLNRFTLSSWMPLKYNADGSLDLYLQNESPGATREANWLPAPKGEFNLTMRLYVPKLELLLGKWNPPPVKRTSLQNLGAQ